MLTRRSYFPPASTIPRRSRKQTTNVVEPEFRTIVTMANNRTMAQMLQAPIEGYEDAIIIAASLEDKLDIRMNRFEKSLNDMKNSFITPTAPLKAVEENTVTQGKFEAYTTANDANMNNLQLKFDNFQKNQQDFQKKFEQKQDDFQNQMMNFMQNLYNNKPSSLSSLPSKIPNPKGEAKAITTRSDFVVLDFIADPRVPLILGRPFLSTAYAIINVYEREIIIRQNQQSLTIQCSDIPSVKKVEQINKIDFINAGGIDFESEEIEDFLNDDSILFGVEDSPFNMDEDIFFLESLLRDDPIPPHPIIPNQIKLPIKEPNHSLNMGYDHFITNLSTEPIKDNSLDFMIISNPLFDNDKINSDEINSHASNFDESTSNHDAEKSDYLDEFYRPFIHIYILEEERTKREHEDYINRMEMLFTINSCPYNPTNDNTNVESFSSFSFPIQESDSHQEEIDVVSVTNDVLPPRNDVSDEEVDVVDVLRDDNFIQNSEHEYSESEDSDFDNLPLPLPRPEPPDKEFDFEKEILVVRNVIVKFECINARVKFDIFNDENDVLSYFMFVIFAKEFSLLFAESEDTIFDPGISD
nr:hypothetical protein [Tanacetum cinerariifolium]